MKRAGRVLEGIAAALLLAAMARPSLDAGAPPRMRWFLVDRSGSAGEIPLPPDCAAGLGRRDRWGVVAFAGDARIEEGPGPAPGGADRSLLGPALDLALRETPDGAVPEWIVLTDGRIGDLAALDPPRGAVSVVASGGAPYPDARVLSVEGPGSARAGERVSLRVLAGGSGPGPVRLAVRAGVADLASAAIPVLEGTSLALLEFDVPEGGGDLLVEVAVAAPGDAAPANDRVRHRISRAGPARVAVVTSRPAEGAAALLAGEAGIDAVPLHPDAAPRDVSGWAAYGAVVLDRVGAQAFPDGALAALAAAVREHGVGLVALGGAEGLGPGGYRGTPVEDALPVRLAPGGGTPTAAALVLDKSGTMAEGARWDLLLAGFERIVRQLGPGDRAGVVLFDSVPQVAAPLGSADPSRLRAAVAARTPGGGTAIAPALESAFEMLDAAPAGMRRVVVLVTDGRPEGLAVGQEESRLRALATRADAAPGIEVWAVMTQAEDRERPRALLEPLCGPRIRWAERPADLPARILETVREAAGAGWVREGPGVPARTPQGEWLPRRIPPLARWARTSARPHARVAAVAGEDPADPVVATGPCGLGRSAVFAGGLDATWAPDWTRWDGAASLLRSLLGQVLPDGDGEGEAWIEEGGDGVRRVLLRLPASHPLYGAPRDLALRIDGGDGGRLLPEAPGVWRSAALAPVDGSLAVLVSDPASPGAAVFRGVLPVPYPAEWRAFGPSPDGIEDLARALGGRVATVEEALSLPPPPGPGLARSLVPACLAAAALLFLARLALAVREAART